jgi:hypothetical protein
MASSPLGLGSTRTAVDLQSLNVAASRGHASALSTSVRLTLGATSSSSYSGMACSCLQCQSGSGGTARAPASAPRSPPDYTDLIKKRGRITTDALLAGGNRWFHTAGASGLVPSDVAAKNLTFSFFDSSAGLNPTDANGFQALDTTQRDRVRDAFAYLSSVIDVSFTEVGSGGNLQFGSNAQTNSAGYARYPNEGSQVFLANNADGFSGDWDEGSYVWQTLLHETAHALGLKHPGNYNAGGGGTPGPYLPGSLDNRNNTLMSYKNAGNMAQISYDNGSFSKSIVNAGTFQRYDIEALQYLYGASTSVTAQTYSWETGHALNNTLWNPNAGSTIDLSNQTGFNKIDLRAGKRSSVGVVDPYAEMPFTKSDYAKLKSGSKSLVSILGKPTYTGEKNLTIAAGSQFTVAKGGSGMDRMVANTIGGQLDGGQGDDQLYWTGGDLQAIGGEGNDTLLLKKVSGARWTMAGDGSSATLTRTNSKTQEVTTLATVSISGIESVRYWDGVAFTARGAALYSAPPGSNLNAVA